MDVLDPGSSDVTQFETGEEPVIWTRHAIVLTTREDRDAPIEMKLFVGPDALEGELAFEGEIQLDSGQIRLGNSISGAGEQARLGGPGLYGIQIYVEPLESPERISVSVAP